MRKVFISRGLGDWIRPRHFDFMRCIREKIGESVDSSGADLEGDCYYFPILSHKNQTHTRNISLPECDEILLQLLNTVFKSMSRLAKKKYLATHRLLISEHNEADLVLFIARNDYKPVKATHSVDPLYTHENSEDTNAYLSDFDDSMSDRPYRISYTLDYVLSHFELAELYSASPRAIRTVAHLAHQDPEAAAAIVQDLLNARQAHTRVVVSPHSFRDGKRGAVDSIKSAAACYRANDHFLSADVEEDTFTVHSPCGEWSVGGPLEYSEAILSLYWMSVHTDPCFVRVLMSAELASLDLRFGFREDLSQASVYHSGNIASHVRDLSLMDEVVDLFGPAAYEMITNSLEDLKPVKDSEGSVIASALCVSKTTALVNAHIFDADGKPTVAGCTLAPDEQICHDLWVTECNIDREPSAWKVRAAVGEERVVIFSCSEKGVVCSPVLTVSHTYLCSLYLYYDFRVTPGFSGGAVVALSDGALLGIHSGSNDAYLIACSISRDVYLDVCGRSSSSSTSVISDADAFASHLQFDFKKRGLGPTLSAVIKSVFPVFDGTTHVGVRLHVGEGWFSTTLDVRCDRLAESLGVDARTIEVLDAGVYQFKTEDDSLSSPTCFRKPNLREKVFVVGTDGCEPYVSVAARISHISADGKFYMSLPKVGGQPLTGGPIVAWDGAVLGILGDISTNTPIGLARECFPVAAIATTSVLSDLKSHIKIVFPYLHIEDWPDGVLEEVFTHSSCGFYSSGRPFNAGQRPLANVGDDAAKRYLFRLLRFKQVPYSKWSVIMQTLQSNAHFAELAWRIDIARFMKTGVGTQFPKDSKAYADLLEAFVGAASLYETQEDFADFVKKIRIVRSDVTV